MVGFMKRGVHHASHADLRFHGRPSMAYAFVLVGKPSPFSPMTTRIVLSN